ncbi:MAG: right-handed parallel beta-helix repeat-containing protein, partial [Candidatus Eisenbacteria sp.]|nr:right-handed parallel beta-helix repeat-containing protein [Candidatus Eisenbacteria bacterium]
MSRHALLFLLLAASACSADAETYLVLPDGSGAYPTIQAAINSASDGDIILLADGVFLGAGNRDIDFSGEAISVQSQSDSPLDCVIDCQGSTSAHHRGFIFSSCETGSSVLRGVTVTNAYVAGSFPAGDGGGVYCEDSSPEIVNCVFSDNVAVGGAGAFCYHGSDPSFTDCTFTGNRELGGTGGAMYCYFVCAPTLLRCDFVGNVPSGLHFQLGSQPDIRDCTFQDHESYGISLSSSDATIVSSSFFGNAGLAIRIAESTVDMSNCALWSNRAEEGGALYFNWGSSGVISDCLFHHNASDGSGGVAWCDDASVTFVSCTMAYNEAGSGAGGIDCGSATVTLENTIIAFSTG